MAFLTSSSETPSAISVNVMPSAQWVEKVYEIDTFISTVGQDNQEYRLEYSLVRLHHSLICFLTSIARSAVLRCAHWFVRALTHSLLSLWESEQCVLGDYSKQ